jgi:xylulose-5-phosphate/fructose-6-phosphate phosphoketolase
MTPGPEGEHLPELKVRVVNVVALTCLQPQTEHPHGLSDRNYDSLFTRDKPIIFGFHGYPSQMEETVPPQRLTP